MKLLFKSAAVSMGMYMLLLGSVAALVVCGATGEEYIPLACVLSAGLTAFFSAGVLCLRGKGASVAFLLLCGMVFFLFAVLTGFLFYSRLSMTQFVQSLAAVVLGGVSASVLVGKRTAGKKRGKRRKGVR